MLASVARIVTWIQAFALGIGGPGLFVVAFLDCPDVTRDGWSANERAVIRAMRWWTLDELRQTSDTVYPVALVDLLPAIIAGDYPDPVRRISL